MCPVLPVKVIRTILQLYLVIMSEITFDHLPNFYRLLHSIGVIFRILLILKGGGPWAAI